MLHCAIECKLLKNLAALGFYHIKLKNKYNYLQFQLIFCTIDKNRHQNLTVLLISNYLLFALALAKNMEFKNKILYCRGGTLMERKKVLIFAMKAG
jgi:hypothetical protein